MAAVEVDRRRCPDTSNPSNTQARQRLKRRKGQHLYSERDSSSSSVALKASATNNPKSSSKEAIELD